MVPGSGKQRRSSPETATRSLNCAGRQPQILPGAKEALRRIPEKGGQSMRTDSQAGSFALNPSTGELVLSREACPIFGFDSFGDRPTCPMLVERMHPDDRDSVAERAERAFRDGTTLEGEYRVLLPDR